jgi:hypothetical protein
MPDGKMQPPNRSSSSAEYSFWLHHNIRIDFPRRFSYIRLKSRNCFPN